MSKVGVTFNKYGKVYVYDTGPFKVHIGDNVVVNVNNQLKVVTVVCKGSNGYTGPISSIAGVVKLDTDLLPNEVVPQKFPTTMYMLIAAISAIGLQMLAKKYSPLLESLIDSLY